MPRNFASVRKVLSQLYRDRNTARVIAEDAGLNPANIPTHEVLTVYWQNILTEAENQGRLEALLGLAANQFPERRDELVLPPIEPDRGAGLSPLQVRVGLRKLLEANFTLEELDTLASDMGIEFENVPGTTRAAKARGLVEYCEHRLRVGELIEMARAERPEVAWPAI